MAKRRRKALRVRKGPRRLRPLSPQQAQFVEAYVASKDLNATEAARQAGVPEKSAATMASRWLRKVNVRAAVDAALAKKAAAVALSGENLLEEIRRIALFDPADCYDEQGHLLPIQAMAPHVRRAIASVRVLREKTSKVSVNVTAQDAEVVRVEESTVELRPNDKLKAIELGGRHLRLFHDAERNVNFKGVLKVKKVDETKYARFSDTDLVKTRDLLREVETIRLKYMPAEAEA